MQMADIKAKLPFQLMPLQEQDCLEAAKLKRVSWFLDVGVGKTVCSTVTSLMLNKAHTIVVCPPILLHQWAEWLEGLGEKASIYHTPKRVDADLDCRWVVMSHAIFRDSFKNIAAFYAGREFDVIIDEAQALKNPSSKLYKCTHLLTKAENIGFQRDSDIPLQLLTATPTSKPEDAYAYIRLKCSLTYRNFRHWENMHVMSRDIFGSVTSYHDLELCAKYLAVASFKRTKAEVFGYDLTPIYQPIRYDLSKKHQKLYKKLAEEQLLLLENGDKIDATTAQRLRHALQQIVVNFSKFSGDEADRSAAYDVLDQVLEEVDPMDTKKSKLVVWTYYVATSEAITAYLRAKLGAQAVVAAYGKVDSAKAIQEIMLNPACRILVAQPASCGVGLNLQSVCSEMLFLEMATSPMQIRQAIGRVDRVGQKIRPTIRFAQALNTIQPRLFKNLLTNADLVDKVELNKKTLRDEIFGA